jgi:hypothetical protein
MKAILLSAVFLVSFSIARAQNGPVNSLPSGKYETVVKSNQNKWDRGDIILLDENKYKVSTSDEVGDYRFSVTAQRIFFTSGPLKSLYAKTSLSENTPAIIFPVSENQSVGLNLPSDVWGFHKQ